MTPGPYEARYLPGTPTSCCDFAVISTGAGREVCRVWDRDDVERLTSLLNGWRPIDTAPKDGTKFWGQVDDDAIAMFWHPQFNEFVSSYRVMTLASGYTFEDGSTEQAHSPVAHQPTAWMPIPRPSSGQSTGVKP